MTAGPVAEVGMTVGLNTGVGMTAGSERFLCVTYAPAFPSTEFTSSKIFCNIKLRIFYILEKTHEQSERLTYSSSKQHYNELQC